MIGKIARRLGFQRSVPVALVDGWIMPNLDKNPVELAPREGYASCLVDQFGRVQIAGASWSLDLTLAAGARWVPAATSERVRQKLDAPSVLETTVTTPSGPVVQRIAAGVVDGQPVAIIEVENTGGVAIAVGMVARPLNVDGRGFIGETEITAEGLAIDGRNVMRFGTAAASVSAIEGSEGDLLQQMPEPETRSASAAASCRSGGAQAAAVWPLPHTATLRVIVELAEPTAPNAAVPATSDVNRGWESHLGRGLRVDVDGVDVAGDLAIATRTLLTLWPDVNDAPDAVRALSEMGFGRDAARFFSLLERCEDDDRVLRSLARWAQLGEQAHQLDEVQGVLGRLGQAAHGIAAQGGKLAGGAWLDDALVTLGGRLHQIEQPDVAERVQGFAAVTNPAGVVDDAANSLAALTKARDKRGAWSAGSMNSAAQSALLLRSLVIDDAGSELRLLPQVPATWRGRTIDVFGAPVANGTISFGLRWHGPRPALLWEATLAPEVSVAITAPGLDPSFQSTERAGETLLADPGWPQT